MVDNIKVFWKAHPLRSILFIGIIIRLIAAIFSTGFIMHDDHFLIIEPAASWANGGDYNRWLPWNQDKAIPSPEGHSLFYPGLHFIFFYLAKGLGIVDPKVQMLLIRLIHAVFSLATIFLSFKITEKLSSQKSAIIVGLAIAVGWAFPFFSVRNLVEFFCIPFFMYGLWLFVKHDFKDNYKIFLLIGITFGIAFSVRLQIASFLVGFGFSLLIMQKWRGIISIIFGFGLGAFLTQGVLDLILWDQPFAELIEYVKYNSGDAKYQYGGTWSWYKYLLVLSFFSVPILGIFWLFGNVFSFKKHFWLAIPLLVFILFHTLFPNQQERFIFPVLPIYIILGVIGWQDFLIKSKFWIKRKVTWKRVRTAGWIINIIILVGASTYSTKQAKVESAYYFYDKSGKNEKLVILQEDSFGEDDKYVGRATAFPKFYAGNIKLATFQVNSKKDREKWENSDLEPEYILLHGPKKIVRRLDYFTKKFPQLEIVKTCYASQVDRLLHYLNPKNKNEQVIIIKTNLK